MEPRTRARAVGLAGLTALVVAGCGGAASARTAHPQVVQLGWHENCGTRTEKLPISTRRLVVSRGRWRVDLSFRNETRVGLNVIRPHVLGGTFFGLEPFRTMSLQEVRSRVALGTIHVQTFADRFSPRRPALIAPGEGWSGSFSGLGDLPTHVPIRVVLGRFVPLGPVPPGLYRGFLCISKRAIRLD